MAANIEQVKLQAAVSALVRQRDAAQTENINLWADNAVLRSQLEEAQKLLLEEQKKNADVSAPAPANDTPPAAAAPVANGEAA